MNARRHYAPLDRVGRAKLAAALGDTPETVTSVYQLREGLCSAYVAGELPRFRAAVVRNSDLPDEPMGFGDDPEAIFDILKSLDRWHAVSVKEEVATRLYELIEKDGGHATSFGDLYCTLTTPAPVITHPDVRRLTVADLEMVSRAAPALRVSGMGSPEAMLQKGLAVGAVIDGRLVGNAHTSAMSSLYADIGIYTIEEYRGRGLANAMGAFISRLIQESGRTPVWSTSEGNVASRAIARKLGYVEVSRRAYVVKG